MITERDTADLEARIRSLENENRALRETLRDKFVAAAVTGLIGYGWGQYDDSMVERAFKIADIMLKGRNT
jgi:hypothetical protein